MMPPMLDVAAALQVLLGRWCDRNVSDAGRQYANRRLRRASQACAGNRRIEVRCAGEDIRSGSVNLAASMRLRTQYLGPAASVGLEKLPLLRKLQVAMFFTGDELVMPGELLHLGTFYNSNRFVLRRLLENFG